MLNRQIEDFAGDKDDFNYDIPEYVLRLWEYGHRLAVIKDEDNLPEVIPGFWKREKERFTEWAERSLYRGVEGLETEVKILEGLYCPNKNQKINLMFLKAYEEDIKNLDKYLEEYSKFNFENLKKITSNHKTYLKSLFYETLLLKWFSS
jgi:hypothetical protein